jgi:hypothetical protein
VQVVVEGFAGDDEAGDDERQDRQARVPHDGIIPPRAKTTMRGR